MQTLTRIERKGHPAPLAIDLDRGEGSLGIHRFDGIEFCPLKRLSPLADSSRVHIDPRFWMNDPTQQAPDPSLRRYRVELLSEVRPTEEGVVCGGAAPTRLIRWDRVQRAMAAEVGEPQGVRTIVFDLVVDEADECVLYRFDAEPGEAAVEVARVIARCLDPKRAEGSIKSLANEGTSNRWYPDLESFEEANLATLS
jgi:hypothetical protein